MIVDLLKAFIERCDKVKVTPNEDHVKAYLDYVKLNHISFDNYFETFVKFIFYKWDDRHNEDLEEVLFQLIINNK